MASTISQVQSELNQLSQDITNTLQTGADVSGPRLAALLVRQNSLANDLATMQGAGASALRYGAGPPANSLGSNNDLYRDTQTGDEYQKVAGSYVLRQNPCNRMGAETSRSCQKRRTGWEAGTKKPRFTSGLFVLSD